MTVSQLCNSIITGCAIVLFLCGLLALFMGLVNTACMALIFSFFAFVYLYIFE